MVVNHGLKISDGAALTDRSQYQRLLGKLIYLSHTRPDIAYAVGIVSQFMHTPQTDHMEAVLRICRYLKGTTGHGILFSKNGSLEIRGYTDADWVGNPNDRRSTAGYFTFVEEAQLADILTKTVNARSFEDVLGKLRFGNPTTQFAGKC
ncbi:secreted RxLR effector protein 161-like [Salvia splendens]|uniref:secreted RxLR effector protein 161-like n=1 Tax=Salvia splendens TaxID=180675 RepID=UPI001C268A81|nr:secreted RxLR effector protein 161-like [Salvia splendens]